METSRRLRHEAVVEMGGADAAKTNQEGCVKERHWSDSGQQSMENTRQMRNIEDNNIELKVHCKIDNEQAQKTQVQNRESRQIASISYKWILPHLPHPPTLEQNLENPFVPHNDSNSHDPETQEPNETPRPLDSAERRAQRVENLTYGVENVP